MTNLVQSLIKIDPTEGLVKYVNSIKPFHTKVLDVLVEYVYTEKISVALNDKWAWTVGLSETQRPLEHACGYGIDWDPDRTTIYNSPQYVVEATARRMLPVGIDVDNTHSLSISMSGYTIADGVRVTLNTTGTLPVTAPQVYIGRQYTVHGHNGAFSLVDLSGNVIEFQTAGTGVLSIEPLVANVNSFLIEPNLGGEFTASVTNASAGQLTFARSLNINAIDATARTVTVVVDLRPTVEIIGVSYDNTNVGNVAGNMVLIVAGNCESSFPPGSTFVVRSPAGVESTHMVDPGGNGRILTRHVGTNTIVPIAGVMSTTGPFGSIVVALDVALAPNDVVYITNNTGDGVNGAYHIESAAIVGSSTVITLTETLSESAHNDGQILLPTKFSATPKWAAGIKLSVSGPATLPLGELYYIPSATPGVFSLATKRYPSEYGDYVRLTSTNPITISKDEAYIPGATINIQGSYLRKNDGPYIVKQCEWDGENMRVHVLGKIPISTPQGQSRDGVMTDRVESFAGPSYCPVSSSSDMHSDAYIHETISFEYSFTLTDHMVGGVSDYRGMGFGASVYGDAAPYGELVTSNMTSSAVAPAGTMLDVGIDMQLFDVGDMNETLHASYKKNGGGL